MRNKGGSASREQRTRPSGPSSFAFAFALVAACAPDAGAGNGGVFGEPHGVAAHDGGTQRPDANGTTRDASSHDAGSGDAATPTDSTVRDTPSGPPSQTAPQDAGATLDASGAEPGALVMDAATVTTTDASAMAPAPDASQTMPEGTAPVLGAADLRPQLISTRHEGELCPPNTVVVSEASDHSALTITFSESVQGDVDMERLSKRCTLKLGFDMPAGYAFSNLHVYASGYAAGSEGSADLTMRSGFSGQSATQTSEFASLAEDFVVYGRFDEAWSPSCVDGENGRARVELVLDVELQVTGDQALSLSALDLGFTYADGARWKRCADGQIVAPPPSASGEDCAGASKHPCAAGLVCDLIDARHDRDELLNGVCVAPEQPAAVAATDEACGGVADIPCAPRLRCHYTSAERSALDVRGTCRATRGDEGDRCGGYPLIECNAGLFCNPDARSRCAALSGS